MQNVLFMNSFYTSVFKNESNFWPFLQNFYGPHNSLAYEYMNI